MLLAEVRIPMLATARTYIAVLAALTAVGPGRVVAGPLETRGPRF
jgi:hypothetical protein